MTEQRDPVPVSLWGRDHWSTLGYIECRCVDNGGIPVRAQMRCDGRRHPACCWYCACQEHRRPSKDHPTILAGGIELHDHDDWDCAADIEAAGFIETIGTGLHPVWRMTAEGLRVAALLRSHKAGGGSFSNFKLAEGGVA